ncbi:MAG: Lrp/AsnC family transcriptional regulator [Candidatus Diapherotrites archaeon]|nr:Lrp/AsnC family transcriptional regulator [Candidatus Diapherotrites archaeon]
MDYDSVDTSILNVLIRNGRFSLRKIAQKAGISVSTVMHRLSRLEKSRTVRSYAALLDYDQLGFGFQAIIDVKVSKGMLLEVERKIATHPNVVAVYDVTGPTDVVVIAFFKTRRSMDGFLKKIQGYDFVQRTETRIILNTLKDAPIQV